MGITIFFALAMPLESEAPATTLELNALAGTRVVVAATVGCAILFLLYFNGLAKATSAADGHFRLAFPHEGATFGASIFFFSRCLRAFAQVLPSGVKFPFPHSLGKFVCKHRALAYCSYQ
jgi:hypothetical protein